jgi:hypothetical protein
MSRYILTTGEQYPVFHVEKIDKKDINQSGKIIYLSADDFAAYQDAESEWYAWQSKLEELADSDE